MFIEERKNRHMTKVALVVINYRDYANKFLLECRDSLRAQTYPRDQTNIYIVDNASTPETRQFIAGSFTEAKIIPRADGNYSAANKAGLEHGLKDGCELFVQVNMDVLMDKDWLSELVMAVESEPNIGIAQSKILLYPKNATEKQNPRINTIGNKIHYLGFGYTEGYGESANSYSGTNLAEIKGYASGCSLIIKKDLLDKIGLPDEEYYMYHDDIELSWRARLAGYKIVLAPKSIIYHKYEFKRSVLMIYYMERNRYICLLSFYKLPTIFLILPALIVMDIGMLLYSMLNGWFRMKLKIYLYFFRKQSWRHILKARRQIKNIRRCKDQEIVAPFSGKILFQEIDNPILKYAANPLFNWYWLTVKKIIFW